MQTPNETDGSRRTPPEAEGGDAERGGRKERALSFIEEMLRELRGMKFTYREIETFVRLKIMEHEARLADLSIVAIDCNPEALSIFEDQLRYISRIRIHRMLLHELREGENAEGVLRQFNLILTTSTHYNEVVGLAPSLADRVLQARVSPSEKTEIEMERLRHAVRIGVICRSDEFLQIIKDHLNKAAPEARGVESRREGEDLHLSDFLNDKDVLVIPPDSTLGRRKGDAEALRGFAGRGGRIIKFEYQLDRGSLNRIEERISELLETER